MNETKHPFSLIAIKDTFNPYPNRFLLHYDKDWDCNLFFSFHTKEDEKNNLENIQEKLSHLLKVDMDSIRLKYVDEIIQTKFSQRDKQKKVYDHRVYYAQIDAFPESEQSDTFEIDGITYKWLSIADMRKDPRIQAVNMDVVDFVSAQIS